MTTQAQGQVAKDPQGNPVRDANGKEVIVAGTVPPTRDPPKPDDKPAADPPKPDDKPAAGQGDKPDKAASAASRELGDNEEPKAGERFTLSKDALDKRIDRARRAELRAQFGTDDPAAIKQQLAELETLKKAEEERKKAAMTELERAKTEAAEHKTRADNLEIAMQELRDSQDVSQVSDALKGVAEEFIKPKFWKHASQELAEHLGQQFTGEQLDAMTDDAREKVVRDWFGAFVKDNPELAKGDATPAKTEPVKDDKKPVAKTVPIVNGTTNAKDDKDAKAPPVITSGEFAGLTAAPGHPNSMTPAQFSRWKRANNYNF